jgi:hypothetical protein
MEWFLQHPVDDVLYGFSFLAEVTMRTKRIARPRLGRTPAKD